jgi:hypothetical protein
MTAIHAGNYNSFRADVSSDQTEWSDSHCADNAFPDAVALFVPGKRR